MTNTRDVWVPLWAHAKMSEVTSTVHGAPTGTGDVVGTLWHKAVAIQAAPPSWVVLLTAAIAAVAVLGTWSWLLTRNVITFAHEGGHALAAVLTGRRLAGIRLHTDTSGVTLTVGRPSGPGMVATAAAGYLAPALLGLGGAAMLAAGHAAALLWVTLALLALLMLQIRNFYGLVAVVGSGIAVFAVVWGATPYLQEGFAYLLTWFLLLGSPRPVFELQARRRRGYAADSDADQLAQLTGVPGLVWVGVFGGVTLAVLVVGARWLIP